MRKLRIVKKSWPDGAERFEIERQCWWLFNKWMSATYFYEYPETYRSLEEAQKNLWRFDGTKYPKVEIIQTNEI